MVGQLEYYFDYNCPYCYISHVMIEKLSKEAPLHVQLISWKMPENAVVEPKPPNYKEEGRQAAIEMTRQLGVSIRFDSPATGTRAAHEATKVASKMGKGLEFFHEVFRQKWVEGRDISDRQLLIDIAGKIGLNQDEFRSSFLNREGLDEVDQDFQRAIVEKIWTIPSYRAHNRLIQIHHFKDMPSLDQLRNFILQGESFLNEK